MCSWVYFKFVWCFDLCLLFNFVFDLFNKRLSYYFCFLVIVIKICIVMLICFLVFRFIVCYFFIFFKLYLLFSFNLELYWWVLYILFFRINSSYGVILLIINYIKFWLMWNVGFIYSYFFYYLELLVSVLFVCIC